MVNVTIKAAMRHGDLHSAIKQTGGVVSLAKLLDVHPAQVGKWYRYEDCPPLSERLPHWPQHRINELEKKMFSMTGKLLEDLFPPAIRDRQFLRLSKTTTATKDIPEHELLAAAKTIQSLSYQSHDHVEVRELQEAVSQCLGELSKRERLVIIKRFGFGCEPMTLEDTGKALGVGKERIRQVEARAIRKLQQVKFSRVLKGHMD
jgi:RNA polymerase sigma factor (sigma-70 family)